MVYKLEPLRPVSQGVRTIAASQIEGVLSAFGGEPLSAKAVHETRKALKRLRALLSLVRGGLAADDLRRERSRLRSIARSLAGARDAHVMLETAAALHDLGLPRDCRSAGRAVIARLEARRDEAGAQIAAGLGELPVERLREALGAMRTLPVAELSFADVLDGFTRTYARGRELHEVVFESDIDDERIHDFRKEVQQHWRHLQLLLNAWPKALRPHCTLARELSETLGKDHDFAMLTVFARDTAAVEEDRGKRFGAYIQLCAQEQAKLRRHAGVLARRLYAEKPKSIRRRIKVYWETAEALVDKTAQEKDSAKVIPLQR